jgi:hypothetical protein
MPIIKSSLTKAIGAMDGKGLALMIIDEDNRKERPKELQIAQETVRAACKQKGATLVDISFLYLQQNLLRSNANSVIEFRKGEANAFAAPSSGGDDLEDVLKTAQIKTIVVMGYEVTACVKATVGGCKWGLDTGAVQKGFRVMTCPQILHGPEVTDEKRDGSWRYDSELLEFYTQV